MDRKRKLTDLEIETDDGIENPAAEAAKEEASRANYVRLNLEVPEEVRTEIQLLAIRRKTTMREIGTEALRKFLADQG